MTTAIANTTTTVTAGEGGLGAYIKFCEAMAKTCENGIEIVETTLNDMQGNHGWFGEKTDGIVAARDQLAGARDKFNENKAALERALAVTEAYGVNVGAGDRESVTNV